MRARFTWNGHETCCPTWNGSRRAVPRGTLRRVPFHVEQGCPPGAGARVCGGVSGGPGLLHTVSDPSHRTPRDIRSVPPGRAAVRGIGRRTPRPAAVTARPRGDVGGSRRRGPAVGMLGGAARWCGGTGHRRVAASQGGPGCPVVTASIHGTHVRGTGRAQSRLIAARHSRDRRTSAGLRMRTVQRTARPGPSGGRGVRRRPAGYGALLISSATRRRALSVTSARLPLTARAEPSLVRSSAERPLPVAKGRGVFHVKRGPGRRARSLARARAGPLPLCPTRTPPRQSRTGACSSARHHRAHHRVRAVEGREL